MLSENSQEFLENFTATANSNELSQAEPSGNTKTLGKTHQLYRWFFTLKEESINLSQLSQTLKEISKEFIFQLEKGSGENGYEHYQGCFSLKTKERFVTVKNHFPSSIHLEPCKDWWMSKAYCSKAATRLKGPWDQNTVMIKTIEKEDMYQWQLEVINILDNPVHDRKVYWFWDSKGNTGKTAFCKFAYKYYGSTIIQTGKTADLAYCMHEPTSVLMNIPRSLEFHVNYSAIESIKDGLIFSGKYESCCKVFNPPHLVIFANFEPDKNCLSKDRWEIREIQQDKRKLNGLFEKKN